MEVIRGLKREVPKISDYANYRRFLKDYYEFKKASERSYNYGVFSARADIKSPNYLKLVMEGKRNLSMDMAAKFAKAMSLTKEDTQEFLLLVKYGQSLINEERSLVLRELTDHRVKTKIGNGEMNADVWDNIPSWVSWVVYEMTDMDGVDLASEDLHTRMRGNVRPQDIKLALEKLVSSGDIEKDPKSGRYKKVRDVIKNREDVPTALVKKLQSELIQIGLDSLYHDPADQREFGALTLCLTSEEFEKLKFELRQLRKRVHRDNAVNRKTSKGQKVYQLNLQLFPLTK